MGIQNPIGGSPKDPFDDYHKRIDEIEREKERKKNEKPPKGPLLIFAKVLHWMKESLDQLTKSNPDPNEIGQGIHESLEDLKECFETIKHEDRSHDPEFLSHFSTTWNKLLEQSLTYKSMNAIDLKKLLKEIQTYPEQQDHSLGYYLTEHAGNEWLPRPYMDLIQKLHFEYETHPNESVLTHWTNLITTLNM